MPFTATSRVRVVVDGDNTGAKRAIQGTKELAQDFAKTVSSNFKSGLFGLFGFEKMLQGIRTSKEAFRELKQVMHDFGVTSTEAAQALHVAQKRNVDVTTLLADRLDEVTLKMQEINLEQAKEEAKAPGKKGFFQSLGELGSDIATGAGELDIPSKIPRGSVFAMAAHAINALRTRESVADAEQAKLRADAQIRIFEEQRDALNRIDDSLSMYE